MSKHTYDSGLIGNCAYIAHIEKDTNVSWLCFPRFDSDFIFGGMLDREKGGEFTILPESGKFESSQAYVENASLLRREVKFNWHQVGEVIISDTWESIRKYG